jgi:chlorophyll synthase
MFPAFSAVLELFKPVTWFPPMWAFMCGVVSSGIPFAAHWILLLGGIALAGPLICATSQAVNDWFDREVDAINEPDRPIPSGRVPGRWGLGIAIVWSAISLAFSTLLGEWVFWAALVGLAMAWAYSAPPLRLKKSGWLGPAAVAISYEGITWFTGAAVMAGGLPQWPILFLAIAYSLGAHGIMTLNDFKAVEGDRQMGIRSLPAELGVENAALIACATMALPQIVVVVRLVSWGRPIYAAVIAVLIAVQFLLMGRLLRDPRKWAPWYNATGTTLYVSGMLVAAFAVRAVVAT